MYNSEIRDMSLDELDRRINEEREKLFNLRFTTAIGQETDTSQFRKARRNLARMITIRRERNLMAVDETNVEGQDD
ncbi:MAG TPA: 50S ribosomal protein L29 [Chloroflexi bacterium]|nr:50S ribosomal protein L29 [Chloroflexota bacterium]|tara:strand:+ start:107 stop:334 length:228 start_codon:yes stop_codon:yes gene_type:complete